MDQGVLGVLPEWFLLGLALGVLVSVGFAGLFVLANWLYPTRRPPTSTASSESRRRDEIRWYLQAIGESFVEDADVGGQSVAFYLPERDVAITFDARIHFAVEQTGTRSVLVEHELPGLLLGDRLPFETPRLTRRKSDDVDQIAMAYAELGLPTSASMDDATAAYRSRVKEVHPDHGGTEAAFRRVQRAYETVREHHEK